MNRSMPVEGHAPADVLLDWRIPATRAGIAGAPSRFFGPGRSRGENLVEVAGHVLGTALLASYIASTDGWSGRSPLQIALLAVLIVDLVGGVLTNASNPAKRWYHREGGGVRRRMVFVASHVAYLVAIPPILDVGGWTWSLTNTALLLGSAVLVEALPVELKRSAAMGLYLTAVLVNLTFVPLPEPLAWLPILFFLKLLVCFLVPEAPLYRVRPRTRDTGERTGGRRTVSPYGGQPMQITKNVRPPKGLARLVFRLPIPLYRMRLGWVFGERLMLLRHTGRVSGRPRRNVLEVVEHAEDGYVAASGFGPKADWYRNVLATPEVTLVVGRRTIPAIAHPVPESAAAEILVRYADRHPRAARQLCRRLMGFDVDGSAADFREVGRTIPFVRFTPRR